MRPMMWALLPLLIAGALAADDRIVPGASVPERIIRHELENGKAYEIVAHLADRIGPRLAGSPQAVEAVRWTTETLKSWGLEVWNEPVVVPHWVRGEERASLVSHMHQRIVLTALGGSVGTSEEGLTAEVVEVDSLDGVDALGEAVRGKIVLYNAKMDPELVSAGRSFEAYSRAVAPRGAGPSRAAKHGAVAALVRSVTSTSLRTPHTGSTRYDPDLPEIPAAAVTTEDAELIHRLLAAGETVRMHLVLTPKHLPDVASANVVAEWKGSEQPEEVVLIGGHLDSWDLGTGAIDNGAGVAGVMETMRLMKEMGIRPRRTVRAVLFMNEEYGLSGARAHFAAHEKELERVFATLESDAGATLPTGFGTTLSAGRIAELERFFAPLQALNAAHLTPSQGPVGADTSPWSLAGVPGFGLRPDNVRYFDYHHSPADTLDKIDPEELARNAAALAVMTWILADLPEPLRE